METFLYYLCVGGAGLTKVKQAYPTKGSGNMRNMLREILKGAIATYLPTP